MHDAAPPADRTELRTVEESDISVAEPEEPAEIKQATPEPTTVRRSNRAGAASAREVASVFGEEAVEPRAGQRKKRKRRGPSANILAGFVGLAGAVVTLFGAVLNWAEASDATLGGVGPFEATFSSFDSSGLGVVLAAVAMLVFSVMLIVGVRPGWLWGAFAALCGAAIIAMVLYSYVDITGKASDAWARAVSERTDVPFVDVRDAGVELGAKAGLWITGLGGLIGALTPPFLRRDSVVPDMGD